MSEAKAAIGPVEEIAGLGLPYRRSDAGGSQNHEAPALLEEEKGIAPSPVELRATVLFDAEAGLSGYFVQLMRSSSPMAAHCWNAQAPLCPNPISLCRCTR